MSVDIRKTRITINATDPYFDLKTITELALKALTINNPITGMLLAPLIQLFFPKKSEEQYYKQLMQQVEVLIDQKIDAVVLALGEVQFKILNNSAASFLDAAKRSHDANDTTGELVRDVFVSNYDNYEGIMIELQNEKYSWVLAPLFASASIFYGTIVRYAILEGKTWRWQAGGYDKYVDSAKKRFKEYDEYMKKVISDQQNKLLKNVPKRDRHNTNTYIYMQPFYTSSVLLIDDLRVLFGYLNPFTHPEDSPKVDVGDFRDVFSPPCGTADQHSITVNLDPPVNDGVYPVFQSPIANINDINIKYFASRPRSINVNYPKGGGPVDVRNNTRTDTVSIISSETGSSGGKEEKNFKIPDPVAGQRYSIKGVRCKSGDIPDSVVLDFEDGSQIELWKAGSSFTAEREYSFPLRKLSTLNMISHSGSTYHYALACVIFGFSRDFAKENEKLNELFFVGSLTDRSELPIEATPELKKKRIEFWGDIKRK